jgi:hypothetical protein
MLMKASSSKAGLLYAAETETATITGESTSPPAPHTATQAIQTQEHRRRHDYFLRVGGTGLLRNLLISGQKPFSQAVLHYSEHKEHGF